MPTPARDFGVQSYCFRHFKDNAQVAQKVRDIGLDKIELCGVHADFNDPAKFQEQLKPYRDQGVECVSIGVQTFKGDDGERRWFECANAAGATHISAHFTVDTFRDAVPKTAALANEHGVRIGIHCHGGYMFGGSPDVVRHLLELGGDAIGVCIDTAWCMQIGPGRGNPVQWAKDFAGRVYGIHYKDFTFGRDAAFEDVIVGEGNLDLPAFITALEDGGFDGMAVIEYEADVENPVPALKRCVDKMRAV